MTKEIVVKINKQGISTRHWYSVGGTFKVSEGNYLWIVMDVGEENHCRGIFKEHCDIVTDEPRLYEHEGVQYVLPEWAKFVTCDYEGASIFAWGTKPPYSDGYGYYYIDDDSPRERLQKYVKPLPAGAFIKEL